MSSTAGKTPAPGQAVYAATKFALGGYFHTLRSEVCWNFLLNLICCYHCLFYSVKKHVYLSMTAVS